MSRRAEFAAVLGICLIGLGLRLVQIDYNFDSDEVFSAQLAAQPLAELIRQSLEDHPHPPLHNLLLAPWVHIFGSGEVSVRSFSVLCSGAFLLVAYCVLRRLVAPASALGALAILSLSPFFVYYGQQARPYSLLALISAINLLVFLRLLDRPSDRRRLISWAVSCAVLMWTQYLAVLTIAVETAVLLPGLPRRNQWALFVGGVGSVATILPWLLLAMGSQLLHRTDPLPHIAWIERPATADLVWFYVGIFGAVAGVQTRWLLLLLTMLGVTYYVKAIRYGLPRSALALTALSLGVPWVVFLLSFYGPKPIFVTRQLIGPALAFVGVLGLWTASWPRWLGRTALMVCLTWSAAAAPAAFPIHSKPPWRTIADYIDREYPEIPVRTVDVWTNIPLSYYRRRGEVLLASGSLWGPSLLLGRPSEIEKLASHPVLLRDWSWRGMRDPEYPAAIGLYEINENPP